MDFEENGWNWREFGKSILRGIWTAIKMIGKGLWWLGKKWWNYLDRIASMETEDFQSKKQTAQTNLTSRKVETVMINGRPFYKDKNGNYKPLDV